MHVCLALDPPTYCMVYEKIIEFGMVTDEHGYVEAWH